MGRGRKPKPTLLHERHGTTNATRHAARLSGEPIAETDIQDTAPNWMTDSQKEGWRYAMQHAPKGLLRAIDRGMLAIWVEAEDRHRIAMIKQAEIDHGSQLPLLSKTKEGNIIQSPYLGIINRAAALMIKAASELGFSPAARPRLAAGVGGSMDAGDNLDGSEAREDGGTSFEDFIANPPGPVALN